MAIENGKVKKKSEKKRYFESKIPDGTSPAEPTEPVAGVKKATKIVFTEDGEQHVVPVKSNETEPVKNDQHEQDTPEKAGGKRKQKGKSSLQARANDEIATRWYEQYENFNVQGELVDLKDAEISELRKLCRTAFDAECRKRLKNNPSDAKWLLSAIEKGTSRDRASACGLLVQANPFCNLQALETVIGMVKVSNKGHLDVVEVLTELMLNSLMPQFRKLIPIQLRGADWKSIQKQDINKELRDAVYANWHFEDHLRELYFNFLTNISMILHSGQEESKCKTIVYASKLFSQVPEKESFMLTMLVNKLGDPSKKVAVKALYHLQKVVQQHTSMALVVTNETEKLLFRNNVPAAAQHYALSFLSTISAFGDYATCQKMVNVCFAFFKILTEKGEVNSRTMQSILTCLRKAIGSIKREVNLSEIVKPELLNVIFRMIHLANISIACQCLALLLEVTEKRGPEQNRFYNALYRKLLDPELLSVGPRISNVLFYIMHRAMQNDPIPVRAQAFVKRLLQVSFYFPPSHVCAVLIVISKVLRQRKNLLQDGETPSGTVPPVQVNVKKATRNEKNMPSGESEQMKATDTKPPARQPKGYDAFHRSSEYAGANYTLKYELTRYLSYFHPTVQKFAESILKNSALTYYGDPLRDFSTGHFLERFSFKNPKQPKPPSEEPVSRPLGLVQKKGDYVPFGSRALPVASLTKDQCTEDDQFIFQYLEKKRERMLREAELRKAAEKRKKGKSEDDDDDEDDEEEKEIDSEAESLDDDEFDAYLDQLGVPGGQDDAANLDREELDFMQELEKDMEVNKKKAAGKKSKASEEEEDDVRLDDWDDVGIDEDDPEDDGSEDDGRFGGDDDDDEFSDGGSVSLEDEDDNDEDDDDDEEDDEGPVVKKRKKSRGNMLSERDFARKLKSTNVNSLFASADEFSEILEQSVDGDAPSKDGKGKKRKKNLAASSHGTDAEVFNQDKSSAMQMAWEQKRFSGNNRTEWESRKKFSYQKPAHGKKHQQGVGKKFSGKGKQKHRK